MRNVCQRKTEAIKVCGTPDEIYDRFGLAVCDGWVATEIQLLERHGEQEWLIRVMWEFLPNISRVACENDIRRRRDNPTPTSGD